MQTLTHSLNYPSYQSGQIILLKNKRYKIIAKGKDYEGHYITISNGKETLTIRDDRHITLMKTKTKGQRSLTGMLI